MKVLVVDDDEILVDKIAAGLDWEKFGVSKVFTANNIRKAREILQKTSVQLLITDIEMPLGNGLELARWVQEEQMGCKYIFISSYAFFAYAQEAIKLQSSQYLLKPFSNEELSKAIENVISAIKKEQNGEIEKLKRQKEQYWTEYLENREADYDRKAGDKEGFFVMLVKDFSGEKELQLDQELLGNTVREEWENQGILCEAVIRAGEMQWFLVGRGKTEIDLLAEQLGATLLQKFQTCYVYYSMEKNALWESAEVLRDVACHAVPGDTCVVNAARWKKRREAKLEDEFALWKAEIENAENCRYMGNKIIQCIEQEFKQAQVTYRVFERLRRILSQLIFLWLEQQKLQSFMFFNEEEFDQKYEQSICSLDSMRSFIRWIFERMDGYRHVDTRKESLVKEIKKYIGENLKGELTRKELAGVVYLSEDYVAKIFMEETGISLSNYVVQKRMKKAQEYLANTDWGIAKIAMEVGYTNFSYFSKTFRGFADCTPNEYRKKNNSVK